jgi:hypothetical protein
VAHEVVHYFIECHFEWRPRTTSEYWELEDLCNSLGCELLAERSGVEEILAGQALRFESPEGINRPLLLLRAVPRVSRAYGLATEPATRRVVEVAGGRSTALGVGLRVPKVGVVGVVDWVVNPEVWLGFGKGTYIDAEHPVARCVTQAKASVIDEIFRPEPVFGADIVGERTGANSAILIATLD